MAGFIFDMDGTLLDSVHVWFASERHVLESAGIRLSKEERDELNTLTLEEAGAWFHERFGIFESGEDVVRAIIDYMLDFYRNEVEAKPGAVEFVRRVHEAGEPMCVLSSSPLSFIEAGLAHAGLRELFDNDMLLSADELGMTKREARTYEHVCGLLGVEPGDTWFFDDSWYALETARGVGLNCVGVHSDDKCGTHEELARYAERVVDDFAGLDAADYLCPIRSHPSR